MTRWDLLKALTLSKERRDAIGKAWPLFCFLIFHSNSSNKYITNYAELREKLKENVNTMWAAIGMGPFMAKVVLAGT